MQVMEEILIWWQRFRGVTLARWLYRIFITLRGGNFLNKYGAALVSTVKDLRVPGRTEPLELDEIYVPLRVVEYSPQRMASAEQEPASRGRVPVRTLSIEDALHVSPHVVLLGQPGSGKSTTLKNLAVCFIQRKIPADYVRQLTLGREGQSPESLLPVFVSLTKFASSGKDLATFLAMIFATQQVPYPQLFIADKLGEGECLLLLDDLDKIADEEKRAQVATEIQRLTEQYPLNYVIVASRPDTHGLLPRFRCWWMLGLDDAGIDNLIARWYNGQAEQAQALQRAMARNHQLRSLAAHPLFLSVLLVGYDSNPERPVRCAALYEGLLRILLAQDNTTQSAPAQKEQILQELALELHTRRTQSLPKGELLARMKTLLSGSGQTADGADKLLDELVSDNILWPPGLGDTYGFAHLALQEYLTASALFARGELDTITRYVDDPWYEQVFVLLAGLQREASKLIGLIRKRSKDPKRGLLLAAHCLAEADQTNGQLKVKIETELFSLFYEEKPGLWTAAATAIAGLKDQSIEATFLKALEAQDLTTRQNAAWALGRVGREWAITPLIGVLEDSRPEVRQRAAWALGQIGEALAISPLVMRLGDQELTVRQSAAAALVRFNSKAVPSLIRALSTSEEQAREMAVLTLVKIGDPAAKPLLPVLGDPDEVVRRSAIKAFVGIGEQAVAVLVSGLQNPKTEIRTGAIHCLGRIGGGAAIRALVQYLGDPDPVGTEAQQALAMIGQPAVEGLFQALGDENQVVRSRALNVLQKIGEPAAVTLIQYLDSEHWSIQDRAAETLKALESPGRAALIRALLEDKATGRKGIQVVEVLVEMKASEPVIAAWRQAVEQEPCKLEDELELHKAMLDGLGELGGQEATEIILETYSRIPQQLREAILQALEQIGGERVIGFLGQRLAESSDAAEQLLIIKTLKKLDGPLGIEALIQALCNPASRIHKEIQTALEEIGDPTVRPLLYALYNEDDRRIRTCIVELLQTIGGKPASMNAKLANVFYTWLTGRNPDAFLQSLGEFTLHAPEIESLRNTLETVTEFAQYEELPRLAEAHSRLGWMTSEAEWLSPVMPKLLEDFGHVSEQIRSVSRTDPREKWIEVLRQAQEIMGKIKKVVDEKLPEPEKTLFQKATNRWGHTVQDRLTSLAGRPRLDLRLISDSVPLTGSDQVPIVLELTNIGDAPAKDVSVRLRLSPEASKKLQVVGADREALGNLNRGESRQARFTVIPFQLGSLDLSFDVGYDDMSVEIYAPRLESKQAEVRFYRQPGALGAQPYFYGRPLDDENERLFFGRREILDSLRARLEQGPAILYGQPRIGKTSVLYKLRREGRASQPQNICVLLDLQSMPSELRGSESFLGWVTRQIAQDQELARYGIQVTTPVENVGGTPEEHFQIFLDEVTHRLGDRRLTLMWDEFGTLIQAIREGRFTPAILSYLRSLSAHSQRMAFVFCGTIAMQRILTEFSSDLFTMAKWIPLSNLDEVDTKRLITMPGSWVNLSYDPEVVNEVVQLTGGHPYYIQRLCFHMFDRVQKANKNYVDQPAWLPERQAQIGDPDRTLTYLYQELSESQQKVVAALASLVGVKQPLVAVTDLEQRLKEGGVILPRLELDKVLKSLAEWDLLEGKSQETEGESYLYGFKVSLFGYWLRSQPSIRQFR